ncbi:MAG: hypothetical protein AAFS10_14730 [Myxococcota bacterium]
MVWRVRTVLLVSLILSMLIGACAAPQKPDEPVGQPPTEEEKRVPKDSTDEDVQPGHRAALKAKAVPTRR